MKKPTTIRIPESTKRELDLIVRCTRRDFSSIVNEMLEESVRMRRFPSIIFADGPSGRRARLAGTGLDVFELIGSFKALGEDLQAFRDSYPWLSELQMRAILAYFQAYPYEIEERLELEASLTSTNLYERYPFMKPECAST